MTMSDSAARCRILVMKHSWCWGHSAPMQFSVVAATSFQSGRSSGRSSISARSPVSVSRRHSSMMRTNSASFSVRREAAVHLAEAGVRRPVTVRVESMQAEVVATPFHVGRGERNAERLAEDRQVLEEDLLLEVFRAGRDEHALAAEDRGHEVGERLSGAGPGFGEQDAAAAERVRHGVGHLELAGTRFEPRQRGRQRAAGREGLADRRGEAAGVILLRAQRSG